MAAPNPNVPKNPADAPWAGQPSGGRKSMRASKAREAGDHATAAALAPPSERPLSDGERCGALNTKNAGYCKARKGAGTDHPGYGYCSKHGGSTEAGNKSAMREMGRDLIHTYKKGRGRFGGNRLDADIASLSPEQALLEEVRRSAAMVRFLEERIGTWNLGEADTATLEAYASRTPKQIKEQPGLKDDIEDFLSNLDPESPDSTRHLPPLTRVHPGTGITSFTDAREWLYLYREERGHLARVAKMALDAGVAQRLVSIAEDQGRILSSALRLILNALGLSPEQQAMLPKIVPAVLRAVATDSPLPDLHALTGTVDPNSHSHTTATSQVVRGSLA